MKETVLGQTTEYPQQYDCEQLCPVLRQPNRRAIGLTPGSLPFNGFDVWHAYELSWLNQKGKPMTAMAQFIFPCESESLIESKSLKLYLNSLNQMQLEDADALRALISSDLSSAASAPVAVHLFPSSTNPLLDSAPLIITEPAGECLDSLDITVESYKRDPALLLVEDSEVTDEILYSNLFKSNCPITAQPDWGTIVIEYSGKRIDQANLLRYVISYRNHEGFHEHCVEQIFKDITERCEPSNLTVTINFLRRGGLDINPVRSSQALDIEFPRSMARRFARQ